MGRKAVGPLVNLRFGPELLARIDADATTHRQTRAAAVRRLVTQALVLQPLLDQIQEARAEAERRAEEEEKLA